MKIVQTNHFLKNLIDRGFRGDIKSLYWTAKEKGKEFDGENGAKILLYGVHKIYFAIEGDKIKLITYAQKSKLVPENKLEILKKYDDSLTRDIDFKLIRALSRFERDRSGLRLGKVKRNEKKKLFEEIYGNYCYNWAKEGDKYILERIKYI